MKILLVLVSLLASLSAAAQDRKTIYVDKMEGLEPFVEKALIEAELPFDFIEEANRPEMKATLKKNHSAYGEIYLRTKTGRTDTHTLELRDVETGKVIASYAFALRADEDARRKAAAAFAGQVRSAMAKMKRK